MKTDIFWVEIEAGRSLINLPELAMDLQELLGRQVDAVPEDGLYWLLRHKILRKARAL